jgi:hypothetical protein
LPIDSCDNDLATYLNVESTRVATRDGEDSYSKYAKKTHEAIRRASAHVRAALQNKAFAAFMCNENACECGPV